MLLIPCQNYSFFGWTRLYWLNDSAICQEQVIKMDSVSKPIRFWKPYWFIKSRHRIKRKFYKRIIPLGLNHKNEPLFFSPRRGEVFFAFPAGKDGMGQKNKQYISIIISSLRDWISSHPSEACPQDGVDVLIEICPSFFLPDGENFIIPSQRGRTGWGKKQNCAPLFSFCSTHPNICVLLLLCC